MAASTSPYKKDTKLETGEVAKEPLVLSRRKSCFFQTLYLIYDIIQIISIIAGLFLVVIASYGYHQLGPGSKYLAILLSMGLSLLLISLLGCYCCHSTRSHSLLGSIYIILILGTIGIMIILLMNMPKIDTSSSGISAYWDSLSDESKKTLQLYLGCCGFNDPKDRPASSCPSSNPTTGCSGSLSKWVSSYKSAGSILLHLLIAVNGLNLFFAAILLFFSGKSS